MKRRRQRLVIFLGLGSLNTDRNLLAIKRKFCPLPYFSVKMTDDFL